MTTLTIILITWFLAGVISNVIIIYSNKEDIVIDDLTYIIFIILIGYISLFFTLVILLIDNVTLPKIKLPNSDKVIWKYPKKN